MQLAEIAGVWCGVDGSLYTVECSRDEKSCGVSTRRPNGEELHTAMLIRVMGTTLVWGRIKALFTLEVGDLDTVTWHAVQPGKRSFFWHRTMPSMTESLTHISGQSRSERHSGEQWRRRNVFGEPRARARSDRQPSPPCSEDDRVLRPGVLDHAQRPSPSGHMSWEALIGPRSSISRSRTRRLSRRDRQAGGHRPAKYKPLLFRPQARLKNRSPSTRSESGTGSVTRCREALIGPRSRTPRSRTRSLTRSERQAGGHRPAKYKPLLFRPQARLKNRSPSTRSESGTGSVTRCCLLSRSLSRQRRGLRHSRTLSSRMTGGKNNIIMLQKKFLMPKDTRSWIVGETSSGKSWMLENGKYILKSHEEVSWKYI